MTSSGLGSMKCKEVGQTKTLVFRPGLTSRPGSCLQVASSGTIGPGSSCERILTVTRSRCYVEQRQSLVADEARHRTTRSTMPTIRSNRTLNRPILLSRHGAFTHDIAAPCPGRGG